MRERKREKESKKGRDGERDWKRGKRQRVIESERETEEERKTEIKRKKY